MHKYSKSLEVRWADLDPNFHMLHSRYYDLGAFVRMCFLVEHGITPAVMQQNHIGPIIFREECVFKKEIKFGDKVEVSLQLRKGRRDSSRWSMLHHITINGDTLAAIITIDGAWMDTHKRKLAVPPDSFGTSFDLIPKSEDFEWI
ncbi:MAG: thioesterase [Bacteroidetes bacterium]|nr:MAG: thioesterase [Bacteroidota bacterium]